MSLKHFVAKGPFGAFLLEKSFENWALIQEVLLTTRSTRRFGMNFYLLGFVSSFWVLGSWDLAVWIWNAAWSVIAKFPGDCGGTITHSKATRLACIWARH
jgi:hypothetical protein